MTVDCNSCKYYDVTREECNNDDICEDFLCWEEKNDSSGSD